MAGHTDDRATLVTRIYDLGIVATMSPCLPSSDSQEQTDVKYIMIVGLSTCCMPHMEQHELDR